MNLQYQIFDVFHWPPDACCNCRFPHNLRLYRRKKKLFRRYQNTLPSQCWDNAFADSVDQDQTAHNVQSDL